MFIQGSVVYCAFSMKIDNSGDDDTGDKDGRRNCPAHDHQGRKALKFFFLFLFFLFFFFSH